MAEILLSRSVKIALSLLIVVIVMLLVLSLLSNTTSTGSNPKHSADAGQATAPPIRTGKTDKQPPSPAAQTLRQRSLR
ncbi:MAG: hypothetical protein ACTHO8_12345 [Solirubrobacterales bacterium]